MRGPVDLFPQRGELIRGDEFLHDLGDVSLDQRFERRGEDAVAVRISNADIVDQRGDLVRNPGNQCGLDRWIGCQRRDGPHIPVGVDDLIPSPDPRHREHHRETEKD